MKSPWKNYALAISYSQTVMPEGSQMSVAFNPYLVKILSDPLYYNSETTNTEFSWAVADAP